MTVWEKFLEKKKDKKQKKKEQKQKIDQDDLIETREGLLVCSFFMSIFHSQFIPEVMQY